MRVFIKAYIKSMRLYYAFITGISGWIGVAYYEYIAKSNLNTVEILPSTMKKIIVISLLCMSWGINQIFNDYLGLKEDKINAPKRPMVSGELNPKKAVMLSLILLLITFLVTCFYLEPIALIPLLVGILLNIIYEYAKGFSILGNIIFGLMISMCTVFGFLSLGPIQSPYFTTNRLYVILFIVLMNGLMTFYTYFKDYIGDKSVGKKTIIVQLGLEKSKNISLIFSVIPMFLLLVLYFFNIFDFKINYIFIILVILTFLLQIYTGYLFYKNPKGDMTYYSLSTNFKAFVCGQATIIALFNTRLAIILYIISYVFIGILFNLYRDPKV